jgi:2-polyprenyl-3-methyl-5-hydroxy-6-metoxy-1,4-benzoquinol methylase
VIIQTNVALLRIQEGLHRVHGTLAGMMALDRPFECYVVGYKPSETESLGDESRTFQWRLERPPEPDENAAPESIIRNLPLKSIYADFLREHEESEVTMLHRDDLYASGPPVTSPSPEMLDLTSRLAGPRILDVGCGIGVFSKELDNRGFKCVGIEWDEELVGRAAQNIEAHLMCAEDLDFEDQSFDTVILFEVLEHLRNPEKALQEISRVVSKNLIVSVPNLGPLADCVEHNVIMHHFFESTHYNFFTKGMMERFLRQFFPHVLVGEFGQFFNVSGNELFYQLYAVASFERIEM